MKILNKAMVLTLAERCKNVLSGNWQCQLHTIKVDAKGSKEDIYSSRVKYLYRKGKPYIWIPENDKHNMNTMIDERGSLSVVSSMPGPLMGLFKSIKKLPSRVALTGDVLPLKEDKVKLIQGSLEETILTERKAVEQFSHSVAGILSSSGIKWHSKSENFVDVLEGNNLHLVYHFDIRSCIFVDGNGGLHEVGLDDVAASKTDPLAPFSEKLVDGINQSQARRRALMLFCLVNLNVSARDAFMLSVDRKGFDVLAKVPAVENKDGARNYNWKEFRFTFKEAAPDIEAFCRFLVEMEEDALKSVSSFSGLGL